MKKILLGFLLLIGIGSFAQGVKIGDLPSLSSGSSGAYIPVTKGGTTYKIAISNTTTNRGAGDSSLLISKYAAELLGFSPSSNQNITGNWEFQGGFDVGNGTDGVGFVADVGGTTTWVGDWQGNGNSTWIVADDGNRVVVVNALNGLQVPELTVVDGSGNVNAQINTDGSISSNNVLGDACFIVAPRNNGNYSGILFGDLSGDYNSTTVKLDDYYQTITSNANNGFIVTAPLDIRTQSGRAGITTPNDYTSILGAPSTSGNSTQIQIDDNEESVKIFMYDYSSVPIAEFFGDGGGSIANQNILFTPASIYGANNTWSISNIDGETTFDGGLFGSNGIGDINANSIHSNDNSSWSINPNGSLSFANGKIKSDCIGNLVVNSIEIDGWGVQGGENTIWSIYTPDGSVKFDNGGITSDGSGNLTTQSIINGGNKYQFGAWTAGTPTLTTAGYITLNINGTPTQVAAFQ